ncbi:MAG: integrase core domain-containing protein [Candidatus Binataceae bacterium]
MDSVVHDILVALTDVLVCGLPPSPLNGSESPGRSSSEAYQLPAVVAEDHVALAPAHGPCMPRSHAFVERLIGTVRREYLDRTLFWNQSDLERKLENYKGYYNQHRCHSGLAGATRAERSGVPPPPIANLESYSWRQHCNRLFQTPTAA